MNTVGSWVVVDPTGRDQMSCYEVGIVTDVVWEKADDGDLAGHPRPLLRVRLNSGEIMLIATVAHVLWT